MKCPNNCGELVEIEKPCFVPVEPDLISFIPTSDRDDYAACYLIKKVCPVCGYYEADELNQTALDKYIVSKR